MARTIHVSTRGSDGAPGTMTSPLRTINRAAELAQPGDTVVVHAGEYREWVKPARGGLDERRRITFTSAPGAHVIIKGSERIDTWEPIGGTVWRATVPNAMFGDFNPFALEIGGDWLVEPSHRQPPKHLGDVYLNGHSFYEVATREAVAAPERRVEQVDHWTGVTVPVDDPDTTIYVWHAKVDEDCTTIWANFHGVDPNAELVEINVRRSVFAPMRHHVDYITVRGFELAQAASPWAPPTADQPGLIGPNWARGWVIEDNVIHDAKCSGISLGKEASTGHIHAAERGDKSGYQYQLESVFAGRHLGWDKEHIGSHVVRRNRIYDCGQAGIVGHLGCAFSVIENNHIHRIGVKREFYGHEIAGIKFHAAIDTQLVRNRIHHCSLGVWLDWQAQGTRVSRNVMYANNRDLFVEVSHGPHVVDHNVLVSPASLEVVCQGGAYVSNLIGGSVRLESVLDRSTPYHVPHSTQIAGVGVVSGGDDRWIGNIFFGGDLDRAYAPGSMNHSSSGFGTTGYSGYPTSIDEYMEGVDRGLPDHLQFMDVRQPFYARCNVYVAGASPAPHEHDAVVSDGPARAAIIDEGDAVYLELDLPPEALDPRVSVVSGDDLPPTRLSGASFEDALGRPVRLDVDLVGAVKTTDARHPAGPLAMHSRAADRRTRVW